MKMIRFLITISTICLVFCSWGCSLTKGFPLLTSNSEEGLDDFRNTIAKMADEMVVNLELPGGQFRGIFKGQIVLLPTTFVKLDDLYMTSSFGRYCAQQLADELHAHGMAVVEVRRMKKVAVQRKSGEFMLSREAKEIVKKCRANTIMMGTYTITPGTAILNVRLIDARTSRVRSISTGIFNRRGNFFINYLVCHAANQPERQAIEIPITSIFHKMAAEDSK